MSDPRQNESLTHGPIRTFEDLLVWQNGIALVRQIYLLTDEGELRRDFGLKAQLRKAAVSVQQILRKVLNGRPVKNI